jgi:hypothetical protein
MSRHSNDQPRPIAPASLAFDENLRGELDLAPEFVCLSFNAWGPSPAAKFRDRAIALALEDNE